MTKQAETLGERISHLIRWAGMDDLLKIDGTVHHNRFADALVTRWGDDPNWTISQPTITRILNGQVTEGSPKTVKVLSAFFGVDASVIRGESPLPRLRIAPTTDEDEMATYLDDVERAKKQIARLKQPALGQVIQLIDTMIALQDERYKVWADSQRAELERLASPPPAPKTKPPGS